MKRLSIGLVAWVLVVASLSSCKTIGVKDVYTSIDANGERRRSTFYTDSKSIYCVVELANGRKDATVEVQFHELQRYDYSKKAFVSADNITILAGEAVAETGSDARMVFELGRAVVYDDKGQQVATGAPYYPGQYSCEVYIEGALEQRVTFNVLFPESGCPITPAVPARLCIGFYPEGQRCPGVPTADGQGQECTCTKQGWECAIK
jgi:hypothetical protein